MGRLLVISLKCALEVDSCCKEGDHGFFFSSLSYHVMSRHVMLCGSSSCSTDGLLEGTELCVCDCVGDAKKAIMAPFSSPYIMSCHLMGCGFSSPTNVVPEEVVRL